MKFEQLNQHLFEQISAEGMSQINGGAQMAISLTLVNITNIDDPTKKGTAIDVDDVD
ncbi:hypothetical protein CLV59_103433 [Chitinophaga dinghuensis]|uniref:Uncharacterized protein n=2 Tax=Chitinophaga dinghuensis TaxID=1539050 RepID=A0A327W5M4_9BACT|nr:hypothetical protein CLV59_103433 [Chitinophaga dinghuensis]